MFKFISGSALTPAGLVASAHVLDYFGFSPADAPVGIANADNASYALPEPHTKIAKKTPADAAASSAPTAEPISGPDVIICTTTERAKVVAAAAKSLNPPYVIFSVVFAEGKIAYGGG